MNKLAVLFLIFFGLSILGILTQGPIYIIPAVLNLITFTLAYNGDR